MDDRIDFSSGYDSRTLPYPLNDPEIPAPQVVFGFKACVRVPKHVDNDQEFITNDLQDLGVKHGRLSDPTTEEIADEDPFVALRLLQVCGVSKSGHVLNVIPLSIVIDFSRRRDEAVAATLATI